MELQQHPLSAAFPAMPTEELDALAEDIKAHGQREPGVLHEDKVLDGWHRYIACKKAGVGFKAVQFSGDDPVAFVKSQNWHRRHLTASQKAAAEVALHEWRKRGEGKSATVADSKTAAEMAKQAGVSPRTIEYAKTAHKAGLGEAVRDGKVTAERAAEIAKLPAKKREKAISEPPERKPRVIAADPKVEAQYAELKGKYEEALGQVGDLTETARELEDKLSAFETTEPDQQQKEIMRLQQRIRKLEGELDRTRALHRDCQNKNNELIREVKRLQKRLGVGQ